ncbi:hypothetical protein [Streptomyces violaceorubidus]
MRLGKRLLSAWAVGAALLLAAPTTAHAGTDENASVFGALVFFRHDGDSFRVCDTLDDAWNVYARYEYIRIDGSIQTGRHYVSSGRGTCKDFDHNFGEGRPVRFTACVQNWVLDYCQEPWSTAVA